MDIVGSSGANSETNSAIVVHDTPVPTIQRKNILKNRKLWKILVILVVMVVIVGGIVWYPRYKTAHTVTGADLNSVQNEADQIDRNQGPAAALSFYKQKIPEAVSNQVKASLDMQAAMIALNAKMNSVALNYARQSDAITANYNQSALIASIYMQEGNSAQAVHYYRLAAQQDSHPTLGDTLPAYFLQQASDAEAGTTQ